MVIKMAEELLHTNSVFGAEPARCRLAGARSTTQASQRKTSGHRGPPERLVGNHSRSSIRFKKKRKQQHSWSTFFEVFFEGGRQETLQGLMSKTARIISVHQVCSRRHSMKFSSSLLHSIALLLFSQGGEHQRDSAVQQLQNSIRFCLLPIQHRKQTSRFPGKAGFLSSKFKLKE